MYGILTCFVGSEWRGPATEISEMTSHTRNSTFKEIPLSGPFLIYLSRSKSCGSGYEGCYLDKTPRLLGLHLLPRERIALANRAGIGRIVGDDLKPRFTGSGEVRIPIHQLVQRAVRQGSFL
jgi:hypothetical protein